MKRYLSFPAIVFLLLPGVLSANTGFVGANARISCHAAQFESWQGSHHDLAMQHANAKSMLGAFDNASFRHGNVTSTFHQIESRMNSILQQHFRFCRVRHTHLSLFFQ
ncbi:MAG: hypothetical protein ABFS22_02290 [Pseudomonadota bacterium]